MGRYLAFIVTLYLYLKGCDHNVWKCEVGPSTGLNQGGAYFCSYTSAYVRSFPELSLVVAVLLIARDILHERLYYGLLRLRGVLQFQSNTMLKDRLVLFYLWCWLHAAMHMLMILVCVYALGGGQQIRQSLRQVVSHNVEDDQPETVSKPKGSITAELDVLIGLVGFFLFPSVLFIVYIWQAYDIEKKLVPLSIYFRDIRDLELEWRPSVKANLVVLEDTIAKALVDEHLDEILAAAHDCGEEYDAMISLYIKHDKQYHEREHPPLGLLESLWPTQLLLAPRIKDPSATVFKGFWLAFALLASSLFAFSLVCLLVYAFRELIAFLLGHQMLLQALLASCVYAMHILVIGVALVRLLSNGLAYLFSKEST